MNNHATIQGSRETALGLFPSSKTDWFVVATLFLVHMVAGATFGHFVIVADGQEYLRLAQNLIESGTFTYDGVNPVIGKPPGFPALISAYLLLTGTIDGFHYLQLTLLFGAYIFAAMTLSRILARPGPLAFLAILVALDPLRDLARNLLTEPLFLFLTVTAIYMAVRMWEKPGTGRIALCGLFMGLSSYVRAINLFWPVALLAAVLIADRRRWRVAVALALVQFVTVAPWIARNRIQFGRLVPMVSNWGLLYYMTDAELWKIYLWQGATAAYESRTRDDIVQGEFESNWRPMEEYRRRALMNIRNDPLAYLSHCAQKSVLTWSYIPGTLELHDRSPAFFALGRIAMIVFYIIVVFGAVAGFRSKPFVAALCLGYAVYTFVMLFSGYSNSRYVLPAYLWLLGLGIAGLLNFQIVKTFLVRTRLMIPPGGTR